MIKNVRILRKYSAVLALTVSAVLFLPEVLFAQGAVIGYAEYRNYAPYNAPPTAAQLDRLTHVIAFSVYPNTDGTLNTSTVPTWLSTLVTNAHAKGVKVSISVGGGGRSANFVSATNSTYRGTFVTQIVSFVNQYYLDGVDINWEYPGLDAQGNPKKPQSVQIAEWNQCIALLNDLKNHQQLQSKRISIALPAYSPTPGPASEWFYPNQTTPIPQQIWNKVDAIHLMTYDDPNWPTHSDPEKSKEHIDEWANLVPASGMTLYKENLFLGCAFHGYYINSTYYANGKAYSEGATDSDNTTSLPIKINHCYDKGYGGVMIWQLAYDKNISTTPELLNQIWGATNISIDTQPAAATAVVQGSISGSLNVTASKRNPGIANLSYQWYSNTTDSNAGGTSLSGATGASYTIPTTLTAGTYYYFCEVKSGSSIALRSNVAEVTVTVAPVITITTQPAAATTVVQGSINGSLSVAASVTQGATLSYQWYSNTQNNNTSGTLISGATNAIFTIPTTLTAGTYYYYCKLSATGGATSVPSSVAKITVVTAPAIAGSDNICSSIKYTLYGGQAITWIVTPPNDFIIVSSSSTSAIVAAKVLNGQPGTLVAVLNGNPVTSITKSITQSCGGPSIDGPATVCASDTYILSSGAASSWSVSSGFCITSSNSGSATVKATALGATGTLTATVNGTNITRNISSCQPVINGSSSICSTSASYSVSNIPSDVTGSQVSWTCSSNLSPQGGYTGFSKTFNVTGGGTGWVKAYISPYNTYVDKNTLIPARPTFSIINLTIGSYVYLTPPSYANGGISKYKWETNNSMYITPNGPVYGISVGFSINNSYPGASHSISVYAITDCGQESPSPDHIYILTIGRSGTSSYIVVYPNPVNDILRIEIDAEAAAQELGLQSNKNNSALTFDIRLYDGQGNILRQQKTKGGTVEFNVANLPDGLYYLHVYNGVEPTPEIQQIMVEH